MSARISWRKVSFFESLVTSFGKVTGLGFGGGTGGFIGITLPWSDFIDEPCEDRFLLIHKNMTTPAAASSRMPPMMTTTQMMIVFRCLFVSSLSPAIAVEVVVTPELEGDASGLEAGEAAVVLVETEAIEEEEDDGAEGVNDPDVEVVEDIVDEDVAEDVVDVVVEDVAAVEDDDAAEEVVDVDEGDSKKIWPLIYISHNQSAFGLSELL